MTGTQGETVAAILQGKMPGAAVLENTLVVIPVYNHAATVRDVAGRALKEGFPVLVVDDGSTDGSFETVAGLPVGRLRLPVNSGKGVAILAGAAQARLAGYEAILTIDADGQHDPADAHLLLTAAAQSWPAIVIGARRMESENVPRSSLFGRDFSNFWIRLECGQALPDTQSGYRLYPVAYLTGGKFVSKRYTFEVEVLVRGSWSGLPLLSVPVAVYYPPGRQRVSHFHKIKDNFRLSCLHTRLVIRSLIPWPHHRMAPQAANTATFPAIMQPLNFFRRLSREHSSPGQLAAAVWVGIFIGALPIIPFGIATILYINHRLHLNKLAGVGASNICCAPFVPLLCVEVGYFIRHGSLWTEFTRQTLLKELHLRLWEWLIGALLIGPLLGGVGALLTYLLVRYLRRQREKSPESAV